jgi:hypothetical protein
MTTRLLTDEPFRVTPELIGAPLASPARRGLALGIDFALCLVPSLAAALGVALLALRIQDPKAFHALPAVLEHDPAASRPAPPEALAAFAPVLVRLEATGLPEEVGAALKRDDPAAAADLLRDRNFLFVLSLDEGKEAEVKPGTIRVRIEDLIPKTVRAIGTWGVMGLYFGLLTSRKAGQTLGKRLLGIRVARLDGHRLSFLESVERFVGYLHVPGSGGLALLDLWRDPNRRMAYDRAAHTVVMRVRKKRPSAESGPPKT